MVLKLSGHVRNAISLLNKQKTGWNFHIWNFFSWKIDFFFQFCSVFTENPLFESGHVWKRHCDVIRWPIFMILVSMERRDPILYHGTKQSYFCPVNFKFKGVVTLLGKPCYKKRVNWPVSTKSMRFFFFAREHSIKHFHGTKTADSRPLTVTCTSSWCNLITSLNQNKCRLHKT